MALALVLPVVIVVQSLSRVQLFVVTWTAACQVSLSFTISWSLLKPCPLGWWCHPTILSSITPFSSCPQSFPAWGCFPMSQFFTSGGQSIGASALASIVPVNIQCWFPLGLTGFANTWKNLGDSQESVDHTLWTASLS